MLQPLPKTTIVDRTFLLIGTASAVWLAVIVAIQGFRTPLSWLLLIPVWAIFAYLALPRLHRMLSDLYVPDYFFGRTRTADGLLGDPVNLAVNGTAAQLDAAMTRAGWHRADEITAASTWRIIVSTLTRRSYPTAPVSSLMLFGRRHDIAYQQEVEGNPKQRHHVRFWHTPAGWMLPGGTAVDWLGAGTYDTDVGLSLFTLQITHRIDENTDVERDFVIDSVTETQPAVRVHHLPNFTTGYHARNGGGDRFITDGDLPILDLTPVRAEQRAPQTAAIPALNREVVERAPLSTILAAVLALAAPVLELLIGAIALVVRVRRNGIDNEQAVLDAVVLVVVTAYLFGLLLLVVAVLRRGRRSRVALMVLLALGVLSVAVDYLDGSVRLDLDIVLLSATMQSLALVALSSDSAAAWVRRDKRVLRASATHERTQ